MKRYLDDLIDFIFMNGYMDDEQMNTVYRFYRGNNEDVCRRHPYMWMMIQAKSFEDFLKDYENAKNICLLLEE